MQNKWAIRALLACLCVTFTYFSALAGDSLYGKVTEVKSADTVLFDYGRGTYVVHLMGVTAPAEGTMSRESRDFVAKMVQGRNARVRLGSFYKGEMYARLLADDPKTGVRDVGLELVRAGLAQRQQGQDYQFEYKYNELSIALREAQRAQRGLWAAGPSR
jgi:endonuclease YncB( thermonuclease family)